MKKIISILMSIIIIPAMFITLTAGNYAGALMPPEIYLRAPGQYYTAGEEITFEMSVPASRIESLDYIKVFIDCDKDVLNFSREIEYSDNLTTEFNISETDTGYVITFIFKGLEKSDVVIAYESFVFRVADGDDTAVTTSAVLKYKDEDEREARLAADLPVNTVFDADEIPHLIITGDLEFFRKGDTIYLPHPVKRAEVKSKIRSTHEEYPITYKPHYYADSEYALTNDEIYIMFNDRQGEIVRICILGDADHNGIVTAADARKVLRYSAKIEPFPEFFDEGCDFDGSGNATAADARKILRVSAKLDKFENPEKTVRMGEEFVIEKLKNAGSGAYNWKCTVSDESAFEISDTIAPPEGVEINPGTPFEQTFTFKALKAGVYNVRFELIASWEDEPIEEFEFTVTVWLDVPIGNEK